MTTLHALACGLQPEDVKRFIQGGSDEMAQLWQLSNFDLEKRREFAGSRLGKKGAL